MDFAQHLVSYYKGEWLEAALLTAFGVVTTGSAAAMWQQVDHNTLLRGFFYPITFLAAFTILAGSFGVFNNSRLLASMPAQYEKTPVEFVRAEHTRFEGPNGVNTWWTPLKLLWATLAMVGIALSLGSRSDLVHGLAIGCIVIGAMGFVIDGFAHHRAKFYTAALLAQHDLQNM